MRSPGFCNPHRQATGEAHFSLNDQDQGPQDGLCPRLETQRETFPKATLAKAKKVSFEKKHGFKIKRKPVDYTDYRPAPTQELAQAVAPATDYAEFLRPPTPQREESVDSLINAGNTPPASGTSSPERRASAMHAHRMKAADKIEKTLGKLFRSVHMIEKGYAKFSKAAEELKVVKERRRSADNARRTPDDQILAQRRHSAELARAEKRRSEEAVGISFCSGKSNGWSVSKPSAALSDVIESPSISLTDTGA
ncbi:hypothetical protein HDU86_002066 [Geranomyces michiganensis]|nr:hypothetical protein HDU86_002066 [Geranomyces michiganensis]